MVPPSVHPNGETVRWHEDPRGVPDVDPDDVSRRAGVTAALAVVLSKYPLPRGNRDNICLALTGVLVRAGWGDDDVDRWVEHVATLGGDEEAAKRGGKAAAPTAGTGKSLLAETIGVIATGHKPAMLSQGFNGEEDQKRLSSVLMAGDQVIVIDNCDRPIQGDFLCSMLTQERVRPRILGKSEMQTLPTRCLVMATGNNLTLSGDVTRRALICRMDPGMERPDQRQFSFDPRTEARASRPELVMAGLTVLRSYIEAGRPQPLDKIGSFEDWNLVRETIVWLGHDDPADTRERILPDDPAKAVLLDLLRLWWSALQDRPVTLAQLATIADKQGKGPTQDLVTELIATTRYQHFNARSVGRFLAKHVDRIVGGLVLLSETDGSGVKAYRVRDVSATARAERAGGQSPF